MKRPPGKDMKERARSLRREKTPAEELLWRFLRNRRLEGFKFRHQMWLCGFVADFACVEARLVVEADGGQHRYDAAYDAQRSAAFEREGYRTLRFWNHEILGNIDSVLSNIRDALLSDSARLGSHALPSPSHPPAAGGPLPLSRVGEGNDATRRNPSPVPGRGRGPSRQAWEGEGKQSRVE